MSDKDKYEMIGTICVLIGVIGITIVTFSVVWWLGAFWLCTVFIVAGKAAFDLAATKRS